MRARSSGASVAINEYVLQRHYFHYLRFSYQFFIMMIATTILLIVNIIPSIVNF